MLLGNVIQIFCTSLIEWPDDRYIIIGALASGDPIIFKKTEERICIYNHEDNRIEDDETYEDFFAFLNDMYDMLGIGD